MAKRPKRVVALDFDGTITDVVEALVKTVDARAMHPEALAELDALRVAYFDKAQIGTLSGDDQIAWLTGTLAVYVRHGLTMREAYAAIDHVRVRRGVRSFLRQMRDHGIPVVVVSYGVRQFIRRVLANNGLAVGYVASVCAADLIVDPITRVIQGYHRETLVIPDNKGQWSLRFADANEVPHDAVYAVGDTCGDKTLGHLRENRFGIAPDREHAAKIACCFGEVVVSHDFTPVAKRLTAKMGLKR